MNELLISDIFSLGGLLTAQVAIGIIIGFFMGYAIKKITKIAIVGIGLFFLLLVYLEYNEFITINYEKITNAITNINSDILNPNKIDDTFSIFKPFFINVPSLVGFGGGFILGLKKG